ncbi:MAG: SCO family protein [Candidatus Binatia bacterium]
MNTTRSLMNGSWWQEAIWMALVLVLIGVIGIGAWTVLGKRLGAATSPPLPVYGTVPDFHLVERSGNPVTQADLAGTIWIADFIFTRCPGVCPLLTSRMAKLQQTTEKPITLVSFSIDPEWDTPERLRTYAKGYGANPTRWLFLTGAFETLRPLITEGFLLAMGQRPALNAQGAMQDNIAHSDRFVLVDRRLRIRGYYRGTEEDTLERILHDVELLQREPEGTALGAASPTE